VLINSANLLFAKIVVDNYTDKIKILPCDFFCAGSGLVVPVTNNSYIKHHFTNSWLPKAIGFAEEVVPPKLDHMLPSTSKSLPKNENS
jgi:hypothetical protein